MRKRCRLMTIIFAICVITLSFSACGSSHTHTFLDATCTEPRTCSECGETEGEALGHDWQEATCTDPKTCLRCGETEGEALGHTWQEATCTTAKICLRCNEAEGEALGHAVSIGVCPVCGESIAMDEFMEMYNMAESITNILVEITNKLNACSNLNDYYNVMQSSNSKIQEVASDCDKLIELMEPYKELKDIALILPDLKKSLPDKIESASQTAETTWLEGLQSSLNYIKDYGTKMANFAASQAN